ncbi:MAG: HAD-IB family phosphatase [Candidatus Thorarchaeota archaeon]
MQESIKVIALDLDGVLFNGPSIAYPLAVELGLGHRFLEVYQKTAANRQSLEDSIIEGSKIWRGVCANGTYDHIVESVPLMTGAEEVVLTLKSWGYKVGCISSGVSQFFMKPFIRRLGLDFGYSNILGEANGVHDGTVRYFMGGPQKAETAIGYLREVGLPLESLASVGDGRNDIDLFAISAFSVAFNPESEDVSKAATVTIRSESLKDILCYFDPEA